MKIISFRTGPISVNTYIVYKNDTKEGFIVDPGGNFKRIVKEVTDNNIKLCAQLLTHGHFDHCGASKQLQEIGVPVYIHQKDAEKTSGNGNLSKNLGMEFNNFTTDNVFKDGDTLKIGGFEIEVMHTPGHTKGSSSFLLRKERVIFTGDTLFNMSVGRTDLPEGNAVALNNSIRSKVFALQGDYDVYPGHDESTTLDYERNYNPYVEYSDKA